MSKGREATNRGRYIAQACNICRARKSKCDGSKPVCGSCATSGRSIECSWGRDVSHRKPRTEAHFEALRKRAEALQAYVSVLEGMLAKCVCQNVSAHHQLRPQDETSGNESQTIDEEDEDSDDDITKELCLATQFLKLDEKLGDDLLSYGIVRAPPNEASVSPEIFDNLSPSYVLLVDGVDEFACDLDIDWSRYLPREVRIDRREHDKILDIFLKFFTIFPLQLVPHLFLRDMHRALSVPASEPPLKTPNYSAMLHNAVLALAASYSSDPYIRERKTRGLFVAAAKERMEATCETPDASLIHATAFLAAYYGQEVTIVLGEAFFGMSIRVGQILGLGVDATPWVKSGRMTKEEMISRNYAHWTLYTLDVTWALYYGKEFLLLPEARDVPMPFVSPEADQLPWHHAASKLPPQPNYLSLIFSASTSLFLICRKIVRILDEMGRNDSKQHEFAKIDSVISQLDLELNSWKSALPAEIDISISNRAKSTPQRLMLHCLYWYCFIHLHRPFFNQSARDSEIDHVKLCKRAAENTLELLETWSKLYTLRYTPVSLLHLVFTNGSVFLLLSIQAALNARLALQSLKKSLSQTELCIHYLREMGKTWGAAMATADILQGLIDSKLKPILVRRHLLVGQRPDAAANTAPSPPGAGDESLARSTPAPLSPSGASSTWNWHESAGDMGGPWPQGSWDFIGNPSANALDGLFGSSSSFAPPMLFPGADLGVDMSQFVPQPPIFPPFDPTLDSERWEQRMLGAEGRGAR